MKRIETALTFEIWQGGDLLRLYAIFSVTSCCQFLSNSWYVYRKSLHKLPKAFAAPSAIRFVPRVRYQGGLPSNITAARQPASRSPRYHDYGARCVSHGGRRPEIALSPED